MDNLPVSLLFVMVSIQYISSTVIRQPVKQPPRKQLRGAAIKWVHDDMTPEARHLREEGASYEMRSVEKVCNTFSKYTPCACKEVLTNAKVEKDGVEILLEYPEYECDAKENKKRFEFYTSSFTRFSFDS